jgi:transcriptional regulator with XRE-family HTH domain
MTTSERIKILRILNGYTQQALADVAGVNRASIMVWEKGKLPTERIAKILSSLFGVNLEYLLEGSNPPLCAVWKLVAPKHPKHIPAIAEDLKNGIPKLFKELEIDFTIKGQNVLGEQFMVCGNDPENKEWKLNYLLIYDTSLDEILTAVVKKPLDEILSAAVKSSGSKILIVGNSFDFDTDFIGECINEMYEFYGKFPDCDLLTEKLVSRESEDDEFTLEGLLLRFGDLARRRDVTECDVMDISKYIAEELSEHVGIKDIKISSDKLLEKAAKKVGLHGV